MFDIGWPELFLIAAVTLVVVGPKEIPHVLRNVMGWIKKARSLAGEFQSGVDDMVREAELDKLKEEITDSAGGDMDLAKEMQDAMDPTGEAEGALDFDMSDFDAADPLPGDDEWTDARPTDATGVGEAMVENSMLDESQVEDPGAAVDAVPETGADAPVSDKNG
jgi:sec-independent protein translocase protein TatB